MRLLTAISCLVASASAASLRWRSASWRSANVTEFKITNFTAYTIPDANGSSISFEFSVPGTNFCTKCSYSDTTAGSVLPDIIGYPPCDNPGAKWQFRKVPVLPPYFEYLITIVYTETPDNATNSTAPHTYSGGIQLPPKDFPMEETPGGPETAFRGDPNFSFRAE